MSEPRQILAVNELGVRRDGTIELEKLSFRLESGETLVILGDATSGKDALARVLAGFNARGEEISGTVQYGDGSAAPAGRRSPANRVVYLGGAAEMPLNPHASVLSQLEHVVARRHAGPRASAREELRIAFERLEGAPDFALLEKKPGELERTVVNWALLAAALAQLPDLLIADHAFSWLTPSSLQKILAALTAEQKRLGFALLYISEGLMAAAHLKSRMIVLRQGRVIEEGAFEKLARGQSHAYTRMLFKSLPRTTEGLPPRASRGEPLLQVQALDLRARKRKGTRSRDGISFELRRGAALALIGEEGSGRRALVRALLGLDRFHEGRVVLDQVDMSVLSEAMTARLRRRIAFITGADNALDPRMTIWDTVDEPLRAHLNMSRDMVAGHREAALKRVGLASYDGRRPVAGLSPFDKRRLQVARAIVSAPFLAVIDEPLRGLDSFAQTILIELLDDLRKQEGPAFLVITADVGVAQVLAEDALFFRDGKVIERGPLRDILKNPKDEETRKLIAAAVPDTVDFAPPATYKTV